MKVVATYKDGSKKEANAGPRSHVMTERHFDKSMGQLFSAKDGYLPRAEYAYYVTWAALFSAGMEKEEDYEKWLDLIDEAGLADDELPDDDDDEKEANPTQKGPSRKRSST